MLPIVGLHLDLKGVQFRPDALPQLLDDARGQGINTLLAEYEDVFPFEGLNIAADPPTAWTREGLQRFLEECAARGLQVIPLQQCLGHLEYLLAREDYSHFALDPSYPGTLDITNSQAKFLVLSMLEQMLLAHPQSRYVHLGMDEAHALVNYAQKTGQDVLALFFGWLDELCGLCERHGKTPIIWSDMLEDYLSAGALPLFERFRERVILCPWDYGSTGEDIQVARIGGWRISREWLDEPDNPAAPPVVANQQFLEDLPPEVLDLMAPYRRGRGVLAMFQVDLWTRLGFRVLGATAVRVSADGPLLPHFNTRRENIRAWGRAIERTGALGLIATSWARGTTWCPPNFPFDVTWPLVGEVARVCGAGPAPFFAGIDEAEVERILRTLGRCREEKNGWRFEEPLLQQMRDLEPRLQSHLFEWRSLMLMQETLVLHRRCAFAQLEVWDFACSDRLPTSQWQRRRADQKALTRDSEELENRVRAHFEQRYGGASWEEWLRHLFQTPATRLAILSQAISDINACARGDNDLEYSADI